MIVPPPKGDRDDCDGDTPTFTFFYWQEEDDDGGALEEAVAAQREFDIFYGRIRVI